MNILKLLTSLILFSFFLSTNTSSAKGFTQYDISEVGWSITYLGCSESEETSTYTYEVYVASEEKDLSHWVLSVEEDNFPVSVSGNWTIEFGLDPTTGVYGIKWDDGQDKGTSQVYSVTYMGACSEQTSEYSVKGGTYYAIAEIVGPGTAVVSESYQIDGMVWLDVNGNGNYDPDEPTFSGVSITRESADGSLYYTQTDSTGYYTFTNVTEGDHLISIESDTSDTLDFNEQLASYFDSYNSSSTVSINGFDETLNFGYMLNTYAILEDLDESDPDADGFTFAGEGRTIGFWKHQHSVAIKGKGRAHIDSTTLLEYLNNIEEFWLANPFNFGTNKFSNSFSILKNTTSDANELMLKQLLGTELNHMHGIGLSENMMLQELIISMAETISANSDAYSREYILSIKDVLDAINNLGH